MAQGGGAVAEVIAQMRLLLEAVPARPTASEVERSRENLREEERSLTAKLGELFAQQCADAVPHQVFRAFQELHEGVLRTQSEVRRKDDAFVLQLEERHRLFGDLLRKVELALPLKVPESSAYSSYSDDLSNAEGCMPGSLSGPLTGAEEATGVGVLDLKVRQVVVEAGGLVARTHDEGLALLVSKPRSAKNQTSAESSAHASRALPVATFRQGVIAETSEPLPAEPDDLLASRWPPELLEILDRAAEGGKHPEGLTFSNGGYNWIPESIGLLVNLTSLDLSGNQLTSLPESLGDLIRLADLDLEANHLKCLPESIGELVSLRKLNIEKNSIEEIPWTIGGCTSLVELRADFNQLKALPEALGQLRELKFLSVHLNCLKTLPTTMSSLTSLTDLLVHFNHLDTLPESLCTLTNLTRLDASSNFAEFRHLPSQIGNLQGLRDLDLSFNHLTVLPDSFALLTNLRRMKLDGNPWRTPPLEVVGGGKEAVLEYMAMWRERDLHIKKKAPSWKVLAIVLDFITRCRSSKTSSEDDKYGRITA